MRKRKILNNASCGVGKSYVLEYPSTEVESVDLKGIPIIYYDKDRSILGMTNEEADKAGVPKGFPKELKGFPFIVDTSASISDKELEEISRELKRIPKGIISWYGPYSTKEML